ncbi:MAG: hypothetical protein EOP04_07460 [Proteobacteria bacterium]|nr:MAG: hypothetical protein EOP04_07460 [Pseudomonadota bacterium]
MGISEAVESARENIEHDTPCEGYRTLKWTSFLSQESKSLLATLYSHGVCTSQDIVRAKQLYASVFDDDSKLVAQALFHEAIQLSDLYERTHSVPKIQNIHALLTESKKMGFQPSDREIKDLIKRRLDEVFTNSSQ